MTASLIRFIWTWSGLRYFATSTGKMVDDFVSIARGTYNPFLWLLVILGIGIVIGVGILFWLMWGVVIYVLLFSWWV